jgi:hypothetical protein
VVQTLPKSETVLTVVGKVQSRLAQADGAKLAEQGLHAFIDEVQLGLITIDQAVRETYFRLPDQAPLLHSQEQGEVTE